jgi:hypothetical protein
LLSARPATEAKKTERERKWERRAHKGEEEKYKKESK